MLTNIILKLCKFIRLKTLSNKFRKKISILLVIKFHKKRCLTKNCVSFCYQNSAFLGFIGFVKFSTKEQNKISLKHIIFKEKAIVINTMDNLKIIQLFNIIYWFTIIFNCEEKDEVFKLKIIRKAFINSYKFNTDLTDML
ncbi:hypothetical protein BpHYR1_049429 [Brachionus plicatilis]|uniref:Uncharacterized protein n=1 Tax=Brachionus plicatilis TaxID=10195 RepID=A0A3M7QDR6_BRAPC|nr:hypothetical protein BpHYR1_049429 [Brachionus plicatilis]